jgi:hypothetical protein
MLPNPNNLPSTISKFSKVALVSDAIALDFPLPKRRQSVRPLRKSVTMPEITVQKNSDSLTREYDVRLARKCLDMLTKPIAPAV